MKICGSIIKSIWLLGLSLFLVKICGAQGDIPPVAVPTLPGWLEMLAGPPGWLMLGILFSVILERWVWYNERPAWLKRGLPVLLAIIASVIARLVLTYLPAAWFEFFAPYWFIIAGAFITWLGSEMRYLLKVKGRNQ
jgi:hypothetical protein